MGHDVLINTKYNYILKNFFKFSTRYGPDNSTFFPSQNLEERLQNFYGISVNDRRLGIDKLFLPVFWAFNIYYLWSAARSCLLSFFSISLILVRDIRDTPKTVKLYSTRNTFPYVHETIW